MVFIDSVFNFIFNDVLFLFWKFTTFIIFIVEHLFDFILVLMEYVLIYYFTASSVFRCACETVEWFGNNISARVSTPRKIMVRRSGISRVFFHIIFLHAIILFNARIYSRTVFGSGWNVCYVRSAAIGNSTNSVKVKIWFKIFQIFNLKCHRYYVTDRHTDIQILDAGRNSH